MTDKRLTLAGAVDAFDVADRLAAATTDELRIVLGHLQDGERVVMTLIQQRLRRERRLALRSRE
jgi:hypothetical protein